MRKVINKDVSLMRMLAALVEWISPDGRRLRPKEVVAEFDKYLNDELDLIREASNCSQLRRNFSHDKKRANLLMVPEVFIMTKIAAQLAAIRSLANQIQLI